MEAIQIWKRAKEDTVVYDRSCPGNAPSGPVTPRRTVTPTHRPRHNTPPVTEGGSDRDQSDRENTSSETQGK